MKKLVYDPREGADALINRLKSMDRNTLKALLASRKDISGEDAERIVSDIESARDEMMSKAEQMKKKIARNVEEAKTAALQQVEETRKTASNVAWWMVATSVVSGIAAVLGGLLGVLPMG